jgi:hypothetical protein
MEEGKEILQEIHEGVCGNHAASPTLVGKALDLASTGRLVWQMPKHSFANVPTASSLANSPTSWLITSSPIPHSWPFACWDLNMIGHLTTVPGGFTHVLVAIDKFTN